MPPGGGGDIVSRGLGEAITRRHGQPVIIDNRAGATGAIGTYYVVKSAPDGYTYVLIQVGPGVTAPMTQKDIQYNPVRDLAPVVMIGQAPISLFVPAGSPFQSLADVVKQARANPGKFDYGTPGMATPAHLTGELLQKLGGISLNHIPFKGSAATGQAVVGGQVGMSIDTVPPNLGLVRAGKLRSLVVTSAQRSQTLPDVPTTREAGFPNIEMSTWYALSAPAATPRPIIDAMNAVTNAYIASPEGTKRLDDLGLLPRRGGTPEELGNFIKAEVAKLEPIIREARITTD
jgi:tripartite-type tricarboxylate transporter receptor subunit TctC